MWRDFLREPILANRSIVQNTSRHFYCYFFEAAFACSSVRVKATANLREHFTHEVK